MVKIGSEYIIDEVTSPNTQTNMDLHIGASTGYANYLRTRFLFVKPGNFNLVKSRKTAEPLKVKLKWSNTKLQTKFGPNGLTFQPVPYNVNMMAMLGKKQEPERATILTEIPHKSVLA